MTFRFAARAVWFVAAIPLSVFFVVGVPVLTIYQSGDHPWTSAFAFAGRAVVMLYVHLKPRGYPEGR